LLDDRRFAGRWILARIRRGAESPLGLIQGLCRRGIDQGIAREARETVLDFDTETELLGRFIAKKHGAPDKAPDLRFLRARLRREGFSTAVLERYWDEHF
jgi:SOS response regulatory protein OraA/RecX